MANVFRSVLEVVKRLQSKTVTAGTTAINVTPDAGYDGMDSVTVNPQSHTGTSSTYSSNGTKDLGANHNIRYVPISVSSTPAISSRVGYEKWYYNQSTYYNNQYVTVSFSGLSTSRPNYLLVIYGRNYETTNDVSASANSGTLSLINSDTQNWKGGSWVYIGYKLYKWTVSSSSASVSIDRGTSNVAAIYNISAWN